MLPNEQAVGQAMFEELQTIVNEKQGDVAMILLGGRGGQALHKLLGEKAKTNKIDDLLAHLHGAKWNQQTKVYWTLAQHIYNLHLWFSISFAFHNNHMFTTAHHSNNHKTGIFGFGHLFLQG